MFRKHVKFVHVPVLNVNLPADVFREVMDLVEQGNYSTPEQFMTVAAYNQLALERVLPDAIETKPSRKPRLSVSRRKSNVPTSAVLTPHWKEPVSDGSDVLQGVLDRLARSTAEGVRLESSVAPNDVGTERIWGQVNRLFPLKLACRWIDSRMRESSAWPKLNLVLDQLPRDAAVFGSFVETLDAKAGRAREAALSAGVPRAGNLASCDRFASQFVARVTRANRVHPGAAFQIGLACLVGDDVQLTSKGSELALLENPLLDLSADCAEQTLSNNERRLLVDHIMESVPAERGDQLCVLTAIRDGHVTPVGLLSYIHRNFPADWSDLAFRTHVYGILARLAELGQIERVWSGRSVHYRLTDSASVLVDQFANARTG